MWKDLLNVKDLYLIYTATESQYNYECRCYFYQSKWVEQASFRLDTLSIGPLVKA